MMTSIAYLVGIIMGVIIAVVFYNMVTPVGVLKIDHSDPEKDLYMFEITEDLDALSTKKLITVKIEDVTESSHK